MPKLWIGIDPGLSGAVAFIHESDSVAFIDMPVFATKKGKKFRNEIDLYALQQELAARSAGHESHLCIEAQSSRPGQGVSSTFTIGKNYGLLLGMIETMRMRYEVVWPAAWKKAVMAGMGDGKSESIIVATRLYPGVADDLRRVKDHNRADALLIAEFSRRQRST